jgi:hypothetical protein
MTIPRIPPRKEKRPTFQLFLVFWRFLFIFSLTEHRQGFLDLPTTLSRIFLTFYIMGAAPGPKGEFACT